MRVATSHPRRDFSRSHSAAEACKPLAAAPPFPALDTPLCRTVPHDPLTESSVYREHKARRAGAREHTADRHRRSGASESAVTNVGCWSGLRHRLAEECRPPSMRLGAF